MARKKKISDRTEDSEPSIHDDLVTTTQYDSIESENQAVELVRQKYQVPDNVKVVYVSEDKQVFFKRNPAINYSNSSNKKLFAIKWD